MTPYYADDWLTVYQGDNREVLADLPDESVHCVVTSPPYWGLRDYGTATWEGGDQRLPCPACGGAGETPESAARDEACPRCAGFGTIRCDHRVGGQVAQTKHPAEGHATGQRPGIDATVCRRCGARRVDSQLGLEPTPEEYVANMVAVFREVRRVLRRDGTLWLNLGDSYANGGGSSLAWATPTEQKKKRVAAAPVPAKTHPGLKPKDLVGIPWMVARSLQEPYYTGRMPKEADRRWLAAMIDGEGSITGFHHIRVDDGRPRTGVHVYVTNSSTALLDEAHRIWPASRSEHDRPGAGHLGSLPTWRWIVHGIENKALILRELYPHLIAKRRQALLAYNLLVLMADAKRLGHSPQRDDVREKRRLLVDLISRANHGETSDVPKWCVEPPSVLEPGWYLRSDIIWSKPNPMPESVTDRPTKSHEYLFLLSKSARYYYDAEAVRESAEPWNSAKGFSAGGMRAAHGVGVAGGEQWNGTGTHEDKYQSGRNLRSVWTIATQPYGNITPESVYAGGPLDTLSPDCPVHSLRAIRRTQRTAGDGELLDHLRPRNRGNGSRPAPMPDDGLFASSDLDSPGVLPATPGSTRLGSSLATTPGSTPESRSQGPETGGDGRASDGRTPSRTSHTLGESTSPDPSVNSDAAAATRRSEPESRTIDASDGPGSSGHSMADRTPDMVVVTEARAGQCSCPKYDIGHFATFPRKLVEPCVKAGTSERGVCPECGAPWERVVERTPGDTEATERPKRTAGMSSRTSTLSLSGGSREWAERGPKRIDNGWRPSCRHDAEPIGAVVLDPFAGSGTTGMVAQSLSRRAVLIDLNGDYLVQAMERNRDIPLGLDVA